jgi:tetratricopeptide (TPR) repeat protein
LVENRRAIELNPTFAAAYCGLGDSLCYEGRYDEALDWVDEATSLPNCQHCATAHRVVALAQLGRRDDAIAAVRTLLAKRPGFTHEFAREKLFYLKRPEHVQLYLGGLADAGIPPR